MQMQERSAGQRFPARSELEPGILGKRDLLGVFLEVLRRYRSVFEMPGIGQFVMAAFACRLLAAMINLALLLATRSATGSYSAAGAVAAAYTLAFSFAYPFWGRIGSRTGFRRALACTALLQTGAFALFVVLAAMKAPAVTLLLAAVLAGACIPPTGAVSTTVFTSVPETAEVRQAVLALNSLLTESVFIAGPLLVAGIVVVLPPFYAVAITAVVSAVGTLWLALTPPVRHLDNTRVNTWRPSGLLHGLGVKQIQIMAVVVLCDLSLGALDVTVVAHAGKLRASAGILLAVMAIGGVAGSFAYGGTKLPGTARQQLAGVFVLFGAAAAPLIAQPGIVIGVIALLVMGIADGPADALINTVAGAECDASARAQLFSLLIPAGWLGYGAGTAVTGYAIQQGSPGAGAVVIVAGAVAAGMLSLFRTLRAPRWPRSAGGDGDTAWQPSPEESVNSTTSTSSEPSTRP
jgi:MFS family permease